MVCLVRAVMPRASRRVNWVALWAALSEAWPDPPQASPVPYKNACLLVVASATFWLAVCASNPWQWPFARTGIMAELTAEGDCQERLHTNG